MATIYLRSSDGSDASDGLTWANAKATLAAALTAAGAGGTVYVADGHAESQATAMSLVSPGTAASPVNIICVDDTGDPEPPTATATTATVTTTGTAAISFAGFAYCYGITFTGTNGISGNTPFTFTSTSPWWWKLDTCNLICGNTGSTAPWHIGALSGANVDDQLLELVNTTLKFGAVGQLINLRCPVTWTATANGVQSSGSAPTVLFKVVNGFPMGSLYVSGVDLSHLGSGKSLIDVSPNIFGKATFQNCKLGSSVSITTGSMPGQGAMVTEVINCDSGPTNYKYYKSCYQGQVFDETTIVRTGGASDGTTPLSHRYVSSENTKFYAPLVGPWRGFWNETTGSAVTVAMECVWFGTALLKDDEAWIEVEYLGTSGFPISSFATDRAADILTAGANQTASTEPWVGTDRANNNLYSLNDIIEVQGRLWICTTAGSSDSSEPAGYASGSDGSSVNDGGAVFRAGYRLTLSKSVTPQEKGIIRARVCLAKASTTLYACPHLEVS